MLEINTFQPALAPAHAGRLVKQRSQVNMIINMIFPGREEYHLLDTFYSPIFLVYARTSIRRMFKKEWEKIKVLCAMDGITGRCGLVDQDLPGLQEIRVPAVQVLPTKFDHSTVHNRGLEYFCRHVGRQFRPVDVERYHIDRIEVFYLPALVLTDRNRKRFFAVDPLTRRVDPVRELELLQDQINIYLAARGSHIKTR